MRGGQRYDSVVLPTSSSHDLAPLQRTAHLRLNALELSQALTLVGHSDMLTERSDEVRRKVVWRNERLISGILVRG